MFFYSDFRFVYKIQFQTVAIMGAHSLGKATLEHAGFDGVWTPGDKSENLDLSSPKHLKQQIFLSKTYLVSNVKICLIKQQCPGKKC